MKVYLWSVLVPYFQIMTLIQDKFFKRKSQNFIAMMKNSRATAIQRRFVSYLKKESSDSGCKTQSLIKQCLNLRLSIGGSGIYDHAKNVCGHFFSVLAKPYRMRNKCLDYLANITNIQRRWRKHMFRVGTASQEIQFQWAKQVTRLVDQKSEYEAMGIQYNLENLEYISTDIKESIFKH